MRRPKPVPPRSVHNACRIVTSPHEQTLLECERLRKEAAKAARAAQRARRRRQDLWEQEVYGEYAAVAAAAAATAANNSALQAARDRSSPSIFAVDNASTSKVAHRRDQSNSNNNNNLIAAPSFQSPMFSPARCASAPPAEADPEMGSSGGVGSVPTADPDEVGVCAQMAPSANAASLAPLAPLASLAPQGGGEAADGQRFESPTSVPSSSSLSGQGRGKDAENFAIAAYSRPVSCGGGGARGGGGGGGGSAGGAWGRGGSRSGIEEDGRRIRSWGSRETPGEDVMMSWAADDGNGGGRITPKTALRFKTSALARAMNK